MITLTGQLMRRAGRDGVAALLIVVVIGVTSLALALNSSLLGLGALEEGYNWQAGGEAFSVADGCLDEILRRIKLDENYGLGAPPFALPVGGGSCTIYVGAGSASQKRNIEINGNAAEYNKKIYAEITISTGAIINIDLWKEVQVLNNI